MSNSIFQKYPKILTFIISTSIFAVFCGLLYWVMSINLFKNDIEKYSALDYITYSIRCNNERSIKLREYRVNDRIEIKHNGKILLVNTDKDGFIKPSFVHEKPDFQIFFIGGSTTECSTIDEELRFPYLVGRKLENLTKMKINSINASRSGNNSLHSINILVNKILPYRPNMVVMMHNVNDLSTLIYEGSYWNNNKSRSHLTCARKNTKFLKRGDEWGDVNIKNKAFSQDGLRDLEMQFTNNLQMFINICKAHNIIPVLMTQANRIEGKMEYPTAHGEEFDRIIQSEYVKFNQIIRDVAKKNNVILVDNAKFIPRNEEYIYDPVHVTPKGSELMADLISKKLFYYIKK